MSMKSAFTFGTIRECCSRLNKITIRIRETDRCLEYQWLRDVPHDLDGLWLCRVGYLEGEEVLPSGTRVPCHSIELLLTQEPIDLPPVTAGITFGIIRDYFSDCGRVSILTIETMGYENHFSIKDVPNDYDDRYLYGFGPINSEFRIDGRLKLLSCLEIALTEDPRR